MKALLKDNMSNPNYAKKGSMSQQAIDLLKSQRRGPPIKGKSDPNSNNTKTTDTGVIHTPNAGEPEIKLTRTGKVSPATYGTSG